MISFVIPAHNEERWIGPTLQSVFASARAAGEPFEVVVVDDASTDRTAAVAAEHGARVVRVGHRQIAATRNAGARAARGDILFFVDADTLADPAAVRAGLRVVRNGAAGGGCLPRFDRPLPLGWRLVYPFMTLGFRLARATGGCFLFCSAAAYRASGGFPEELFASEELVFIRRLKRVGRFVVLGPTVVTSGRKLDVVTVRRFARLVLFWLRNPDAGRTREGLDLWYGEIARPGRPGERGREPPDG
jgi:glycosyltransferase involved in cell wall biosynthesis